MLSEADTRTRAAELTETLSPEIPLLYRTRLLLVNARFGTPGNRRSAMVMAGGQRGSRSPPTRSMVSMLQC